MKWTFRAEYVRCGKSNCKSCPHGPYWYGYRHQAGKMHKKYFGKEDPRSVDHKKVDRLDSIFSSRTASMGLALEILGWETCPSKAIALGSYRALVMSNHPDRGGDHKTFTRINAAWSYVKASKGW